MTQSELHSLFTRADKFINKDLPVTVYIDNKAEIIYCKFIKYAALGIGEGEITYLNHNILGEVENKTTGTKEKHPLIDIVNYFESLEE